MRINLKQDNTIDELIKLCEDKGQSPTQYIIDLIHNEYAHTLGCKANEENTSKNDLH